MGSLSLTQQAGITIETMQVPPPILSFYYYWLIEVACDRVGNPILTWLLIGLKEFKLFLLSQVIGDVKPESCGGRAGREVPLGGKKDVGLGVLGCFQHLESGHLTAWSQVL